MRKSNEKLCKRIWEAKSDTLKWQRGKELRLWLLLNTNFAEFKLFNDSQNVERNETTIDLPWSVCSWLWRCHDTCWVASWRLVLVVESAASSVRRWCAPHLSVSSPWRSVSPSSWSDFAELCVVWAPSRTYSGPWPADYNVNAQKATLTPLCLKVNLG